MLSILGLSMAVLIFFYFIERRAAEPIIPLDLFHLNLYRTSTFVATLAAMGVFGAISYLPLYLQGVLGMSASGAGMILLLLSLGWTAGSLIAGQGINRLGYRSVASMGMSCMAVGFGIFVLTGHPVSFLLVLLASLLIGLGMGTANLTTLVAAQNAVPIRRIGVATSTLMLFRTFGGAFCISLMGTVLFNRMQLGLEKIGSGLSSTLRDKVANPQNLLEPVTRASIPMDFLPQLINLLADSIWYAFLTAFLLMIIGCVVSARMGSYTPASTPRPDGKAS
jgi:predicted MFS family arabinose efflux permease